VIDLGEERTPPVLGANAVGAAPAYRTTYIALAQERFADAGTDGELASDKALAAGQHVFECPMVKGYSQGATSSSPIMPRSACSRIWQ
jgi:hypothetical protein